MPTFGFSAFLKLLSLPAKPQRTECAKRLAPGKGGYDFHRSFRLYATRHLRDGEPISDLLEEAKGLINPAESRSAQAALLYLQEWREEFSGPLVSFLPKIFESPHGVFKVHFTPDFGIKLDGVKVAVHIWNTKRPDLDSRLVYAALTLIAKSYVGGPGGPHDLAVLSVPDRRLFRLSDVPDQTVLANRVVTELERKLVQVGSELNRRTPTPPSDQPPTYS